MAESFQFFMNLEFKKSDEFAAVVRNLLITKITNKILGKFEKSSMLFENVLKNLKQYLFLKYI